VPELWRRIDAWLRRRSLDRDLDEELRFHIDMKTRELGDRTAATRALGGALLVRERARDPWGWRWLDEVLWDIRYALRVLRSSPGFTAVAVLTLALGIGVNATVFTVTNALLFKGFPSVVRNDRILYIHSEKNGQYSGVSYPDFQDWRDQVKAFDSIGTVRDLRIILNDRSGFPENYTATLITANAFQLLGQKPILGRDFAASDERPGAAPVAILTNGFWEQRFGKDPAIVGQTLSIHSSPPTTVIGVMPKGFSFPQNQDLWMPLVPTPELQRREFRPLWFAFGRLADGATAERARAELEVIGQRLASTYPRSNQAQIPTIENFIDFWIVRQMDRNAPLMYRAMWGAVGLVLLIACANLANLMLARAIGRSREMSLRMALGSGRWRIIRQVLTESLILSAMGGVLGWGIAKWGARAYQLAIERQRQAWSRNLLDYTMDNRSLAYLMAISIGAGLLFGLAPALRFSKRDFNTLLKDGGRGAMGGRYGKRLSGLLVIGEVALAVVLLAGAGVMIRSFLNLATAHLGVRTANTLVMGLNLPQAKYPTREAQVSFFDRLKIRLEAVPGVDSTAIGPIPTFAIGGGTAYELTGGGPVDEQSRPTIPVAPIGPDYFRTLGVAVRSGREFNMFDGPSGVPVVLVNQRFATQHWPREDPLGQRVRLFDGHAPGAWRVVVGVVPNLVQGAYRQEIDPLVYVPYRQGTGAYGSVFVRTSVPTAGLVPAFRREISALDPDLPIWNGPDSLADDLTRGLYGNIRNHTVVFLIFAAIALLLASMGLYAVVAYSASLRTQEIGVRMAIGATARDILTLVLMQALVPLGIGLTFGLAASLAVTRVLTAELVQVSPADPITFVVASAVLMVAATLGCLIPARRAMRVDPVVALRHE
jgi:putative ABC transport system permease protein